MGWYKGCRRLGTRYEEPAVNHLAFWMVAMIEKDLRLLGSSDRGASGGSGGIGVGGHRGDRGDRGASGGIGVDRLGGRGGGTGGHRGQTDLEFFVE